MIYVTKDLTDLDLNPDTEFVLVRLRTHAESVAYSVQKRVYNCTSKMISMHFYKFVFHWNFFPFVIFA